MSIKVFILTVVLGFGIMYFYDTNYNIEEEVELCAQ